MRTIIAGSRGITDIRIVDAAIKASGFKISSVVCGMCKGPDLLGKELAEAAGVPVNKKPAQWRVNGVLDRSAGYKRNVEMSKEADALIAIWDGKSPGTKHMIDIANAARLKVFIYYV